MAEHIVSPKIYVRVWLTLLIMTGLTWYASTIDIGIHTAHGEISFNPTVALLIAFFKASLVVLFFMGIKYTTRLQKVVIGVGIFWLFILLSLTMVDYVSRTLLTSPNP
jgi:cytochrome c oxidase subunit 4